MNDQSNTPLFDDSATHPQAGADAVDDVRSPGAIRQARFRASRRGVTPPRVTPSPRKSVTREDNGVTDPETLGVTPTRDDDRFEWSAGSPNVVIKEQCAVAVYENPFGSVVIRQERAWDEDNDPFVCVRPEYLHQLIAALQCFLPR